jgi:hypothetical protein
MWLHVPEADPFKHWVSQVNSDRENPFITPEKAVVCVGFSVRADYRSSGETLACPYGEWTLS